MNRGVSYMRRRTPAALLRLFQALVRVRVPTRPPSRGSGLLGRPDPTSPYGVRLEYVRLPAQQGFRGALPRRWVVERTFAWFCHSRRFSRDYERLCSTSEALIYIAMERLMLRRLARL